MGYDWKQLGAKIAKVGVAFLATGGVAALGGAAPLTVLLSALTGEAIIGGFGEIAEGVVSGIVPKEREVYERFQSAVQGCVLDQLKLSDCPSKLIEEIKAEIMESLFGVPVNAIVAAAVEPRKAAAYVNAAFTKYMQDKTMTDEDIITFVDGLFSRLVTLIDNDHEFTTTVYLKSIVNKIELLQATTDESLHVTTGIDGKLNSLIEILTRAARNDSQLSPQTEQIKYVFEFVINTNGDVLDWPSNTQNAIREWFYDCARVDLSSVSDECLADTFRVVIVDERELQAQTELDTIAEKLKTGESLDALGEHRYSEY